MAEKDDLAWHDRCAATSGLQTRARQQLHFGRRLVLSRKWRSRHKKSAPPFFGKMGNQNPNVCYLYAGLSQPYAPQEICRWQTSETVCSCSLLVRVFLTAAGAFDYAVQFVRILLMTSSLLRVILCSGPYTAGDGAATASLIINLSR